MLTTIKPDRIDKFTDRAFKSERELQEELAKLDLNLDGSHTITFFRREVPVGKCIPDLIYVRFAEKPEQNLWPSNWTFRHSYAIWLLRQRAELTINDMAAYFYESPNGRIKDTMLDLAKCGAVDESTSQTYILSGAMKSIKAEVIAAEAKMSQWTRAIEQAQDYMNFADKVFVAMDDYLIPQSIKVLERFCELGIGLCTVSPGRLKWLVYPRHNQNKRSSEREYLIASAASSSRQILWSAR
jgi:hypothetical protein